MLKKKIKEGTFLMENSTTAGHSTNKKGPDADKVTVNVESMLDTLRKKIEEIYKREIDKSEVTSKKTIDLLNVRIPHSSLIVALGNRNQVPCRHESAQKHA